MTIAYLDRNANLTLKMHYGSIGILEHVHLACGHQIGQILNIAHQVFVSGTACFVNESQLVLSLVVLDLTRVHQSTKCIVG